MLRIILAVSLCLALAPVPASAEKAIRIAEAGEFGPDGLLPAVAPTADGFAVAWCEDLRCRGLMFARYGPDGSRTVDPLALGRDYPVRIARDHRLIAVGGGFVSYSLRSGNPTVVAIRTDEGGRQLGAATVFFGFEGDEELFGFWVATNRGAIVTTRAQWYGSGGNWSQRSDDWGRPLGAAHSIFVGGVDSDLSFSSIIDSPVSPLGNGFVTVWGEPMNGIVLRELRHNGKPHGADVEIAAPGNCERSPNVGVAAGGVQAIVYSAGCEQKDVFLRTRDVRGRLSAKMPLATETFDEGIAAFPRRTWRPIRIAAANDRVGVLYVSLPFGPFDPQRWIFAEFDLNGGLLGARRDLFVEFGLESRYDIDLQWDAVLRRYLLAWSGHGPEGPGVYVLPLLPAR